MGVSRPLLQAHHSCGVFNEVAGDKFRCYPFTVPKRQQDFLQPWRDLAVKFVSMGFEAFANLVGPTFDECKCKRATASPSIEQAHLGRHWPDEHPGHEGRNCGRGQNWPSCDCTEIGFGVGTTLAAAGAKAPSKFKVRFPVIFMG
jgi:hypothetical protein